MPSSSFPTQSPLAPSLDKIGILEFLEQDPRPSFILELKKTLDFGSGLLHPVVCNTALLEKGPLFGAVVGTASGLAINEPQSHAVFRKWVMDQDMAALSIRYSQNPFVYHDYSWTRIVVQQWTIISGVPVKALDPPLIPEKPRILRNSSESSTDSADGQAKRGSGQWAFDPVYKIPHRASMTRAASEADTRMEDVAQGNIFEPITPDESMFKRLAEVNPAGVFFISPIGEVLWANESWYSITDHPHVSSQMSFMDCLVEEDLPMMQAQWHVLLVKKRSIDLELRLRKKWYHAASNTWKPAWIQTMAAPELNHDGSLKSVMGCLRDITATKQAHEDRLEHARVSAQLARKTQQYSDSENRFALMASLAPYGLFSAEPDGRAVWVNQKYCEMTRQPEDVTQHYPRSSYLSVAEEHHARLDTAFEKLVVHKEQVSFEYRTITPCVSYSEDDINTHWHHCIAFPVLSEDGSITSLMGILTDITHMKAAEALQIQSRIHAEEAKKEQEKFMDITSHELRNPLSAILQSADSIITSLTEYQDCGPLPNSVFDALVESSLDSVQIIMLCAQHQGRIINDVLTLSKLDSGLLQVSVIPAQPIKTMQQALRMFAAEVQSLEVGLSFQVEASYRALEVDWVLADPSRLTQVFINLMTNAIKFTKGEKHRMITVTIGASKERPKNGDIDHIEWFPTRSGSPSREPMSGLDWTDEGQIYLTFAVQDTGRGLSHKEKTRLFHRFSQANPRTHVEYGGSGLGLFISRELTERQGGEIGVRSVAGEGSTFAFYVKAQKVDEPTSESRRSSKDSPFTSRKGSMKTAIFTESAPQTQQRPQPQPFSVPTLLNSPSLPPTATQPPSTPSTPPKKPPFDVLLVEDNLVNQKVLSKQLLKAGCTVHLANHGQEALDLLRRSNPLDRQQFPNPIPTTPNNQHQHHPHGPRNAHHERPHRRRPHPRLPSPGEAGGPRAGHRGDGECADGAGGGKFEGRDGRCGEEAVLDA